MTHPTTRTRRLGALAALAFLFAAPAFAKADSSQNGMMGHMDGNIHATTSEHMSGEGLYGEPGDASKADRTITITATEIAFDLKDIEIRKGETIRFVLINKGEQPHELVLGDADEQAKHRQMMIDMAGMNMSEMHHSDHNSVSAEPGETKELVWHFTKAGTFEFACNYPGHADLGMAGTITVR
jgi:uncharacterized cupredoxin-like copper-binding protein